jgi:hypothetical protein
MTISKELLDELLKGCERPEDLLGDAGLMKQLKIKLIENGGDKLDHGSGGFSCRGRSKTLPPVAFDLFGDGRREDVHRGSLLTSSACLSC